MQQDEDRHSFNDMQRLSACLNQKVKLMRQLVHSHTARCNEIRDEIKCNNGANKKKVADKSPSRAHHKSRERDMLERDRCNVNFPRHKKRSKSKLQL